MPLTSILWWWLNWNYFPCHDALEMKKKNNPDLLALIFIHILSYPEKKLAWRHWEERVLRAISTKGPDKDVSALWSPTLMTQDPQIFFPVRMPWKSGGPPQLLEMKKKTIRPPGTNIYPYSDLPWRGISLETLGKAPESNLNTYLIRKYLCHIPSLCLGESTLQVSDADWSSPSQLHVELPDWVFLLSSQVL